MAIKEETPITIKIHGDYLKLVEKKKREEDIIPEVTAKVAEEEVTIDLEEMITFDEDFDSEYDEDLPETLSSEEVVMYDDDDEDEDDEWSKFDGF